MVLPRENFVSCACFLYDTILAGRDVELHSRLYRITGDRFDIVATITLWLAHAVVVLDLPGVSGSKMNGRSIWHRLLEGMTLSMELNDPEDLDEHRQVLAFL